MKTSTQNLLASLIFTAAAPLLGHPQNATPAPAPNQSMNSLSSPSRRPSAEFFSPMAAIATDWTTLRAQAESGNAPSAYEVGRRYEHGIGVRCNPRKALHWYRCAAGSDFANALPAACGDGAFNSSTPAFKSEGLPRARYSVGRLLASGDLGRPNYAEAFKWFQRAARQGHVLAQNRLGLMYQRGQGVAADPVAAIHWFTLSVRAHEYGPASANLRALAARLTPKEIAEGEGRAAAFILQTADNAARSSVTEKP